MKKMRYCLKRYSMIPYLLQRDAVEFCTYHVDIKRLEALFYKDVPTETTSHGGIFFEDGFYPYEFFDAANEQILNAGTNLEQGYLYIYIYLTQAALRDFKQRFKESNHIFFKTQRRLGEERLIYNHGKPMDGIYDYHFCANHVRGNILRIYDFEFQLGMFEDKKAIIMHVPTRAHIDIWRNVTYSSARYYFGDLPIILDSWLLFEEHKNMLSENSRILSLMEDFDIIRTYKTYDYRELFHVFGRLESFEYQNLPKETTLQRAYAERIKQKLYVGSAVGVLKPHLANF